MSSMPKKAALQPQTIQALEKLIQIIKILSLSLSPVLFSFG